VSSCVRAPPAAAAVRHRLTARCRVRAPQATARDLSSNYFIAADSVGTNVSAARTRLPGPAAA
jgi:hypothetical protein